MTASRESDLYPPVKAFLEGQDYDVKGEVQGCDLVASRGEEDPVVVELKTGLNLTVILQAIERQKLTEAVYVAVPDLGRQSLWKRRHRAVRRLFRMLGLGLLNVHTGRAVPLVEPLLDPQPYQPRGNPAKRRRLLKEFAERIGDPNLGGQTRRPIVTAYRQDALACVLALAAGAPLAVSDIRAHTGVERAASILQRNVYGWFDRIDRGVYDLSPKGRQSLDLYADVIETLEGRTDSA